MNKKLYFALVFISISNSFYGQINRHNLSVGFYYGFGNEFKNRDYTFNNIYYRLELNYLLKETKTFKYELVIQPELNCAKHKLINTSFITPANPNYIQKRDRFSKINDIYQYVLNFGFILRKPILKSVCLFVLGSFGPMISASET